MIKNFLFEFFRQRFGPESVYRRIKLMIFVFAFLAFLAGIFMMYVLFKGSMSIDNINQLCLSEELINKCRIAYILARQDLKLYSWIFIFVGIFMMIAFFVSKMIYNYIFPYKK